MRYSSSQSGFSLVETLVAITILVFAVTAPIVIVTRGAQGSRFSSEQVVATFLAQEGLELAQKVRDDAFLAYYDTILNNGLGVSAPPGTTDPDLTFNGITQGQVVAGNIDVDVLLSSAVENDPGFDEVRFYIDGSYTNDECCAPYDLNINDGISSGNSMYGFYDTTLLADGAHLLEARVYDGGNNIMAQASIGFLVDNGSTVDLTPWETTFDENGVLEDCFDSAGCALEIVNVGGGPSAEGSVAVMPCVGLLGCGLFLDEVGERARYTHDHSDSSGETTFYYRNVHLEHVGGATSNEIKVTSEVIWRTGSLLQSQQVVTETAIFNLYDLP